MNKNIIKIVTGVVACVSLALIGVNCTDNNIFAEKNNLVEPIIYTEVSNYDTLYDFSDDKILAEHSDLIVVGKLTDIGEATNYNPISKKYGKARTPGNLEVMKVLKSDGKLNLSNIEFTDIGGTLPYEEYAKGLLPAQRAKREYLMQQSGIYNSRSNILINQTVENQLKLEEDKTYIMYLYYNEDFDEYMVVNQPYGIKEYNVNTGKIINHVTNEIATLEELI